MRKIYNFQYLKNDIKLTIGIVSKSKKSAKRYFKKYYLKPNLQTA